MTPWESERFNSKYSAFYVTRFSSRTHRHVQVGKAQPTIEAALAAAKRADMRRPGEFHFIDVVRPN